MRLQAREITLGAKSWIIRPLTVAQVQAIEPLVIGSVETRTGSINSAISIIRLALDRDHPADAAALSEIETSAPEIAAAMRAILQLGGFLPNGDPAPGEAAAGLGPASTGPLSTPV
jgi:hypothetical protein